MGWTRVRNSDGNFADEDEDDEDSQTSTKELPSKSFSTDIDFAAQTGRGDLANTPTPTPSVDAKAGGMSGGATAGIVGGIIAVVLVLLAIVAFFYRKKQQKRMQEAYGKPEDEKKSTVTNLNEKDPSPFADQLPQHQEPPHSAKSFASSETAPRVSYRPGSEFAPNFTAAASGAAAGAALSTSNGHLNPASVPASRPQQQQEIVRKPAPQPLNLAQSNFGPQQIDQVHVQPPVAPFVPGAQASPASSTFSEAPSTPGGTPGPQMLVFRVQMDFKPSMGDELELKSGELVRLMHEYDDGWALCSRMDRSQQGVCPRTCLSQRPVKPRPRNGPPGPPGPGQRGPPPRPGPPGQQSRPQTPNGGYVSYSRPQTPNGQRGQATPQHSPPKPVVAHIIPEITVSPVDDTPPYSLSRPETPRAQGQGYGHSPLAN